MKSVGGVLGFSREAEPRGHRERERERERCLLGGISSHNYRGGEAPRSAHCRLQS